MLNIAPPGRDAKISSMVVVHFYCWINRDLMVTTKSYCSIRLGNGYHGRSSLAPISRCYDTFTFKSFNLSFNLCPHCKRYWVALTEHWNSSFLQIHLCLYSLQGAKNVFKNIWILDLEVIQPFLRFLWLSTQGICFSPVPWDFQFC